MCRNYFSKEETQSRIEPKIIKTITYCPLWLWRSFVKSGENNPYDVTVMSSGLSWTGLDFMFFFPIKYYELKKTYLRSGSGEFKRHAGRQTRSKDRCC